jgi:hypothetical protein
MYCLDVNNMRGKPLLRMMASYCTSTVDSDRLLYLASPLVRCSFSLSLIAPHSHGSYHMM